MDEPIDIRHDTAARSSIVSTHTSRDGAASKGKGSRTNGGDLHAI